MGTVIEDTNNCYIKRFFGGTDRGVCFSVNIHKEFTQKELAELISKITDKLIV